MIGELPKLEDWGRERSCGPYSTGEIDAVVCAYIFEGMSNREMDDRILNVESGKNHGWRSFAILHHFGLGTEFKGYFEGKDPEYALASMSDNRAFGDIAECIKRHCIDDGDSSDPELESAVEVFDTEGRKILYYGTKYERSRKNREAAIRIHGTKCMVCGFDFEEKYGELGKDFVEVHHVKPLSSVKETKIDPRTDLVCLCSNCHRMIHRTKGKVLTCEELREIIEKICQCTFFNKL